MGLLAESFHFSLEQVALAGLARPAAIESAKSIAEAVLMVISPLHASACNFNYMNGCREKNATSRDIENNSGNSEVGFDS
jgi:hypothetical protein